MKRQSAPEVGLLVGKYASGSKALLLSTIKTPRLDGLEPLTVEGGSGPPQSQGGGKGKKAPAAKAAAGSVTVALETDWVVEHARQVARMLPGGLSVLGAYVFCTDPAFQAAQPQLGSLLSALAAFCLPPSLAPPAGSAAALLASAAAAAAEASSSASASTASSSSSSQQDTPHLLLLHVDSGARRQALRSCPAGNNIQPSALRPVELRYAATLSGLVCVRCWHGIDLALPVPDSARALQPQLEGLVAAEEERIRCGVFAAAGSLAAESQPAAEAFAAAAAGSSSGGGGSPSRRHGSLQQEQLLPTYDVSFLAPLVCHAATGGAARVSAGGATEASSCGLARLRGAVQGVAFVGKREPAGKALAELRADLISSLKARLQLLLEEAERSGPHDGAGGTDADIDGAPTDAHPLLAPPGGLRDGCVLPLPRRVMLPWLGGLQLCDYLLDGEPADAATDRARVLLGVELEGRQVIEAERPPAMHFAAPASPWRPHVALGEAVPGKGDAGSGKGAKGPAAAGSSSAKGSGQGALPCSTTVLLSVAVAAVASGIGIMSLSASQW